jgi:hypothetical protein
MKRSLSIQIKDDDMEQQRKIFHIRYHISNKLCNMIIDSGSCVNASSATLIRKLNLNTIKHEKPYRL